MVLAEALLRVPDAATADRLIEDKLATGDWDTAELKSDAFLVSASAWTLGITARIIQPGETPETILDGLLKRLGVPAVRTATRQAMRLLGSHFVLGQTIEEALRRAGVACRRRAIRSTCWARARAPPPTPAAISKPMRPRSTRSARAPATARCPTAPASRSSSRRCIRASRRCRASACWRSWCRTCSTLARKARGHDLNFTIDAEEADRLELTLDVIAQVLADPSLRGWEGFGLAVQAYQKRAEAVIGWLDDAARGAAPPADGAAGQGRLLGHRGQARAGARACRLSGVHPQGDDRPLLRRLHAAAAGGAARACSRNSPPTMRSPSRA